MPKIIGFLNLKGGVGKTHISTLASLALADAGKRVLVKDFDPQGSISEIFLGWDGLITLERNVRKYHKIDTGFRLTWLDLSDIELERYKSSGVFDSIITTVDTGVGEVDIFPVLPKHYADTLSMSYNRVNSMMYEFFKDLNMYDYIIVDLPPQPIPPTIEVLKAIDAIIPPVLYNHISTIRPAQLLLARGLLNKEVISGRQYYGMKIPVIPGIIINMVTRSQVGDDNALKPGLPFLRALSRGMYNVYLRLMSQGDNDRLATYIDPRNISSLYRRPYIADAPVFKYSKVKSTDIKDYVLFYLSHDEQRKALKRLVNLLDRI